MAYPEVKIYYLKHAINFVLERCPVRLDAKETTFWFLSHFLVLIQAKLGISVVQNSVTCGI